MTEAVRSESPPTGDVAPSADKIRIEGLSYRYRRRGREDVVALDDVDLTVGRGEFLSVAGPSGCGKSTLLRVLAGLQKPTDGVVRINHEHRDRPLVAPVFQEYSIFPWRSVEANVRLGLDAAGVDRAEARRRSQEWIERVGLAGFEKALPGNLSGGMKQRVALARAFVVEPEILLMDEPFAALDAQLRKVLQEELLAIVREHTYTVFFVTHNLDEAILLSDRIALMSARPGRVRRVVDVPFARPRSAELRKDPEFARLEEDLWADLKGDVETIEEAVR
ncbi:ABC transporter ATP-binding protein [Actinomadura rugatobispora]|uniref:ABC transporter ATP-binding protein n=1 Tax=Actinomadura rugatobispora TaxID=1994 RepID=A0ABW0ZZY3_9ACTN|nr:ABC transporter ATP-binding protein [Actinomadura rugatobispora]